MNTINKIMGWVVFLIILAEIGIASESYKMYGWNGTTYVPLRTKGDGTLMTDLNLLNITANEICVNDTCVGNFPTCTGTDKWTYNGTVILCSADAGGNVSGTGADTQLTYWNTTTSITGDSNLIWSGNALTVVGELIINTITLKGNLTPYTDDLYNLGNSTNWLANIWVKKLWAEDINTSTLTATDITSATGDIDNITSTELNLGGNKIINVSGDMVVVLT